MRRVFTSQRGRATVSWCFMADKGGRTVTCHSEVLPVEVPRWRIAVTEAARCSGGRSSPTSVQREPGRWTLHNGLPVYGHPLSREVGTPGHAEARHRSLHPPAAVVFVRQRRPRPSLPFPGLRRLASGTAQRLLMSIAGSSSGDDWKTWRSSWACTSPPHPVGGPRAAIRAVRRGV